MGGGLGSMSAVLTRRIGGVGSPGRQSRGRIMVGRIVMWFGLAATVLLAACGGDDADTATDPPPRLKQ